MALASKASTNFDARTLLGMLARALCESSEFIGNGSHLLSTLFSSVHVDAAASSSKRRRTAQLWRLALNLALGISFTLVIVSNPNYSHFFDYMNLKLVIYMESLMAYLTHLINWLMGVPAGLKLNKPLNDFLGRFFMYHIYLWNSSLEVFKEILPSLLKMIIYSGVFGLSSQLALVSDVFKLFTVHKYCFYIYAVRIYKLEIESLMSLFRLFRGKKLNPLRNRIDSYLYDVDQLFIGTLAFCVVFFLFPTIFMYYVVFLILRILIVVINSLISQLIKMINFIPIYELLVFIRDKSAKRYALEVSEPKPNDKSPEPAITLIQQTQRRKFKDIVKETDCHFFELELKPFKGILGNIFNGTKF